MYKKPTQQRNEVILEMYYNYIKEHGWSSAKTFAKWLVKQPAPKFYVEYDVASRNVSLIIRDKAIKPKKKIFYDIAERLKRHPKYKGSRIMYPLLSEVIESEAPSFYLSIERIVYILYKTFRKK